MLRVCALIALATSVAAADPKAADVLAAAANALAKQGDFAGAAAKFRAAHTEDPRAELICNVGVSYFKAKDPLRAQRYLQDCLQVGAQVPPAFVATVKQVLAQLEDQLRGGAFAPVNLVLSPAETAVSVVGNQPYDEPAIGSRVLWFPHGAFTLQFHADGFVDQVRSVDASGGSTITVTLEPTPVAVVVRPPPPPPPAPKPTPSRSILRPTVITVAAVGVGIASLAFFLEAVGHANDANNTTDPDKYNNSKRSAEHWQLASIVTGGAAAVTAGVAAYFWYRDLHVEPQPGGAVLALRGTF